MTDSINSWAFQEANRILLDINHQTPEKGYVLFETGYGPSGLPHIGTFGEVVRTKYVMLALRKLAPEIPQKLFVVSDDYDALRKVPENVPDREKLKEYIGVPLINIPDPYGTHGTYGNNMNNRLEAFLKSFDIIDYTFVSSSAYYKNGTYNETLKLFADHNEEIKEYIKSTIGEERGETYNPFIPIDPATGRVVYDRVESVNAKDYTITYIDANNEKKTQSIFDGMTKLQWKCDFAMRWMAFDVNYELYGKDVATNQKVYYDICRILKRKTPINMQYELFLDSDGKKISKSKGNGLTIDDWLHYANKESLSYYMYLKPKTAKKLYFDVIPRAVDEYLGLLSKISSQDEKSQLENPVFYVHDGSILAARRYDISYSMLLNLASTCNTEDANTLWGFINKYDKTIDKNDSIFNSLITGAINYYHDFVKPNKNYRIPTEYERSLLMSLQNELLKLNQDATSKEMQDILYDIGNKSDIELLSWFQCLYECLLGLKTGPRFGTFIEIYGINNTISLIEQALKR